jgi:hypothetical protein
LAQLAEQVDTHIWLTFAQSGEALGVIWRKHAFFSRYTSRRTWSVVIIRPPPSLAIMRSTVDINWRTFPGQA